MFETTKERYARVQRDIREIREEQERRALVDKYCHMAFNADCITCLWKANPDGKGGSYVEVPRRDK